MPFHKRAAAVVVATLAIVAALVPTGQAQADDATASLTDTINVCERLGLTDCDDSALIAPTEVTEQRAGACSVTYYTYGPGVHTNYTTVGAIHYTYFFLDANVTNCGTAQSMIVDVINRPAATVTNESTVSGTNYCVTKKSCKVHTGWGHADFFYKLAPVCFHASARVVANGVVYQKYFPASTYGTRCY